LDDDESESEDSESDSAPESEASESDVSSVASSESSETANEDDSSNGSPSELSEVGEDSESETAGDENGGMTNIGVGTLVPTELIRSLNWSNPRGVATRLLVELFDRETLKTHSLYGRASNAFPQLIRKPALDAEKINDIIFYVYSKTRHPMDSLKNAIQIKLNYLRK
jgi:hypothetical protein